MRRATIFLSGVLLLLGAAASLVNAQANSAGDLKESITGGFIYGIPFGDSRQNPAPGYSLNYMFQPVHWLALEAGLEQVIHPVGTFITQSDANRFVNHANDQLYLVPFGPRVFWAPHGGRGRVSAGAGGAYLTHHYGPAAQGYDVSLSNIGFQVVASGDYALSSSGRFRLGLTARYYYVRGQQDEIARILTIGPSLTFSFR